MSKELADWDYNLADRAGQMICTSSGKAMLLRNLCVTWAIFLDLGHSWLLNEASQSLLCSSMGLVLLDHGPL